MNIFNVDIRRGASCFSEVGEFVTQACTHYTLAIFADDSEKDTPQPNPS